MPNVNCLQYATKGNDVIIVPAGTWTSAGFINYLANPVNEQISQTWSTLALAVKRLVTTQSGWRVPKSSGPIVPSETLRNSGVILLRILAGNDNLNWTKRSGISVAIPLTDGVIVMGEFNSGGGVHYFARKDGVWMGVPGPADTIAREVTVTGNSSFTQEITGGTKSGTVSGWFS